MAARRRRHDRALPRRPTGSAQARSRRCARTSTTSSTRAPWLPERRRAASTGVGGAVRNLAAAAMLAEELPSYGVQGYLPAPRRARRPGRRGSPDMTPARAPPDPRHQARARRPDPRRRRSSSQTVMETSAARRHRGHPGRPARGRVLRGAARRTRTSRCFADVRAAQRPQPRRAVPPRPRRTRSTSPGSRWRSGTRSPRAGVHPGDPEERELLWAAAMLHDVGTAVDYDDHHKHSRYLILNAGLPGFSPRETALIGQAARYHRKGRPALREFAPLARKGDEALLAALRRVLRRRRAARARARPDRPPRRASTVRRRHGRARAQSRRRRHRQPLGRRSARPTCSAARSAAT